MSSYFAKKKNSEEKEEIKEDMPNEENRDIQINPQSDKLQEYEVKSDTKSSSSPSTNTHEGTQKNIDLREGEENKEINPGDYLKSGIYGGLDGLINTLSLILGGIGAAAASDHILLICLAGLIGDGISMGLGDYLSSKSELQFVKSERKEKQEILKNDPKLSNEQMKKVYMKKGYSQYQAKTLTDYLSTNSDAFMNILIAQQMGLGSIQGSPAMNGIVNFLCFTVFGFLPILPYIINRIIAIPDTHILIGSLATGGFLLLMLGLIKAWLTGASLIKSGITTLMLGSFAVGVGYAIGVLIDS